MACTLRNGASIVPLHCKVGRLSLVEECVSDVAYVWTCACDVHRHCRRVVSVSAIAIVNDENDGGDAFDLLHQKVI